MVVSRQFALGILIAAALVSLAFVAESYSIDPSQMTRFLRYLWMFLYFLFAMVVMFCAEAAFQFVTGGWSPPSRVGRYSKVVGNWTLSAVVLWLAFWYQSLFSLWIVFVLALVALFWILFRDHVPDRVV